MRNPRSVGQHYLAAFAARDYARIEACFHPQARFRALIPPGAQEAVGAQKATSQVREWFGEADSFEMVSGAADTVSDRLHLGYRLLVHDADGWQLFEQQAYCRVQNGSIEAMDLLCSGPLPCPDAASSRSFQ